MPLRKDREQRNRNHTGEIMIIPVRCFTCGKPVGHLYAEYKERVEAGEPVKDVLDSLGLERYCCRRMILSHAELIDEVLEYNV